MLKTGMEFSLKDIMDLDFLLDLDEGQEDRDNITARDRDIFKQIDRPDLDDKALILNWLSFRKLLFFHEAGEQKTRLPGTLYGMLYRWMVRGAILLGFVFGLLTAYSFLAYHGSRPVNVTLFIAFFILFPALLSLVSGTIMVRWVQSKGSSGTRYAFLHTLIFEFFMKRLQKLAAKAGDLSYGDSLKSTEVSDLWSRFRSRAYKGILFWPFFMISSLAALCFSLGALGGTLFRVMVTDLAFGWQSTLFTSGAQIHKMITGLALPWSWLPSAVPSLAQVEGSRIILKQGIMGLATENLVAWWPFLCMGILAYGILPRLALAAGAAAARTRALAGFDFNRPRYKRLVMRMRTPVMDMDIRETGGTRAKTRDPLPEPLESEPIEPIQPIEPVTAEKAPESKIDEKTTAWVLASERVYPDGVVEEIGRALELQLGVTMAGVSRVGFDFEEDKLSLSGLKEGGKISGNGPVIILQEVWQPPIRGLLYYFKQLRQEIFPKNDLWIFLTRTPGEGEMGVDHQDMDYKVWQTAVAQLKDPGIIPERWVP